MKHNHSLAAMTLAALGIVYGDIGTSPLYTFKETFAASQLPVNETNVFGFLSLIIWALLLIVTLKYVLFVLRADNRGEGGVVIMMQQAVQQLSGKPAWWMLLAGLTGTALFFGDAIITPAISVLSAAEGLIVINPDFEHWVMPIALTVLVILFLIQKYGTQRIGALFGPIMLAWFSVLALAGLYQISQNPHVWMAVNPYYGIHFATHHGWHGFVSLGAVVLAVTGAEALYADMGHFGRKPIQTAWLGMVLPALALNYIGQGALLLRDPSAIDNPFFKSVPQWGLIPLIVLATAATIIASQAVISGAYSLTQQAIQLGLSPRMLIKHTSDTEIGQIYMPAVNWLLLAAVLVVIVTFRTSGNLAAAYGIAATGTMILTTLMFSVVMYKKWRWPLPLVGLLTLTFLTFDITFFASNLLKIPSGGWLPLLIAVLLVFIFSTWRKGREILHHQQSHGGLELVPFLQNLAEYPPQSVAGNAVFMVSNPNAVPSALLHNLKHNKVLHEYNVILTIRTADVPYVHADERIEVEPLTKNFVRVTADYGFQETPNIRHLLLHCRAHDVDLETMDTSFFLSRDSITVAAKTPPGGMNRLRTRAFRRLYRNSTPVTHFYNIPSNRVIEMGSQVRM